MMLRLSGKRGKDKFTLVDDDIYERFKNQKISLSNQQGYPQIWLNGKVQYLHRIIMELKKGDKYHVDHINHNTLDNRRVNLKLTNRSGNMRNRKGANKNSLCGQIGVHKVRKNYWQVRKNEKYYKGFSNLEEAIKYAKELYKTIL